MSDREEPGLDELERQLDAAFRATTPRHGFADELWAQLQARRPWWRRLGDAQPAWAAAGGVALLLVVVLGVAGLARLAGPHASGGASTASRSASATEGATAPRAALPAQAQARLPAPTQAGVAQVIQPYGGSSPLPAGAVRVTVGPKASLPQPGPMLPVYSYVAGSGPADGAVLAPDQVPTGLPSMSYLTRPPGSAFAAADARTAAGSASLPQSEMTVTDVRLVYVAVVAGGQGYLEPAYLATGTAPVGGRSVQVQVLVSALAASALP